MPKNTNMPCDKCGGSGKIPDPRLVGEVMRAKRELLKVSLRYLATRMGLSAAYVSDLELGRRAWSREMQNKYLDAIHDIAAE